MKFEVIFDSTRAGTSFWNFS